MRFIHLNRIILFQYFTKNLRANKISRPGHDCHEYVELGNSQ